MPANIGCITTQIANCAADSASDLNIAQLAGSVIAIENGDVNSVACSALLPTASENTGRWYYVDDLNAWRYSDGESWTNTYSTSPTVDRRLFSFGYATSGQLGDNDVCGNEGARFYKPSPVQEFSSSINWSKVYGGLNMAVGQKEDGTIWTWGCGTSGKLGDNSVISKSSPVQEASSSLNWSVSTVSGDFGTAIKTDGTLWGWGCNRCGVLGDDTTINTSSPIQEITSSTDWVRPHEQQSFGLSTAAIKTDGTLWLWGRNGGGALMSGDLIDYSSPIQEVSSSTNWCLVSINTLGICGHSHAIKTDGTLWSSGCNRCGQLGVNSLFIHTSSPIQEFFSATNWCYVTTSVANSIGIKTDGTLWAWGSGCGGTLGVGSLPNNLSRPTQEICSATNWCLSSIGGCGYCAVVSLKTDGTLWVWGRHECGTSTHIIEPECFSCSPVQEKYSLTNWYHATIGRDATHGIRNFDTGYNEP